MRLFVVFALALPLSAIAAPAPVDKLDERQEPGPSGRVVSPDEYSTFTAPSGIIDFSYEMVTTLYTVTRSVTVSLVRKDLDPPYNHTLATNLGTSQATFPLIRGYFRIPRDIPGSSSSYQLEIVESQHNRESTDEYYTGPFVAAAPYITIMQAMTSDDSGSTEDHGDGPGPSGYVVTPSGDTTYDLYAGRISFEYAGVDLSYTKTRSVNAYLVQQSTGLNVTLGTDLSGAPGDETHSHHSFRVPRELRDDVLPVNDLQVYVIETQVNPNSPLGDTLYVPPFVAAAPYVGVTRP